MSVKFIYLQTKQTNIFRRLVYSIDSLSSFFSIYISWFPRGRSNAPKINANAPKGFTPLGPMSPR